jgi:phospholipid/cholesterol/gamma-HCH transport system substrate-binding protein
MDTHTEKFKFRLGLFILIGFIFFILAIFVIGKQKNLFDPVFRLTASFYNVSGLQVGNLVRFSGINVGTVDGISIINDSTVMVSMMIRKNVQRFIKTDSEIGIGSDGLIGDKILIITQGSTNASQVEEHDDLLSSEPIETDVILESLETTALNVEIITNELAEVMLGINSGKGTLGRLIHDNTIANNLGKTMDNLEASTKGLEENMEAAQSNILLRGFFKKKEKDQRKALEAAAKKEEQARKEQVKNAIKNQKDLEIENNKKKKSQ